MKYCFSIGTLQRNTSSNSMLTRINLDFWMLTMATTTTKNTIPTCIINQVIFTAKEKLIKTPVRKQLLKMHYYRQFFPEGLKTCSVCYCLIFLCECKKMSATIFSEKLFIFLLNHQLIIFTFQNSNNRCYQVDIVLKRF